MAVRISCFTLTFCVHAATFHCDCCTVLYVRLYMLLYISQLFSSYHRCQVQWHSRGLRLAQSAYRQACEALADIDQEVRLSTVRVVWVLSQLYPDRSVYTTHYLDTLPYYTALLH